MSGVVKVREGICPGGKNDGKEYVRSDKRTRKNLLGWQKWQEGICPEWQKYVKGYVRVAKMTGRDMSDGKSTGGYVWRGKNNCKGYVRSGKSMRRDMSGWQKRREGICPEWQTSLTKFNCIVSALSVHCQCIASVFPASCQSIGRLLPGLATDWQ